LLVKDIPPAAYNHTPGKTFLARFDARFFKPLRGVVSTK
jgi:hypothetical protein